MAGTRKCMERSVVRVLKDRELPLVTSTLTSNADVPDASEPTTRKASSRTVEVLPAACTNCRIKVIIRSAKGWIPLFKRRITLYVVKIE